MDILVVGGFLGSGKTSFILQLARELIGARGVRSVVILENEIGECSVDDKLLRASGLQVRGLFSGCVCCTLAGELAAAVRRIGDELRPDWLIVEATGLAFPGSVRETLHRTLGLDCRVCVLTDALRWKRLFAAVEELMRGQLEDADTVLVNKADAADAQALAEAVEAAREIHPGIPVLPVSAGGAIPAPDGGRRCSAPAAPSPPPAFSFWRGHSASPWGSGI